METEQNKESQHSVPTKDRWVAGIVVAGSIVAFSQQFKKSSLDEFIILVIAIGAGYFYYKLKRRIKIKHDGLRALATYFSLLAIAAFLIGACTALANGSDKSAVISGSTRDYFVEQTIQSCSGSIPKDSGYSANRVNEFCSCYANGVADITSMQQAESFNNNGAMSADYRASVLQIGTNCKQKLTQ